MIGFFEKKSWLSLLISIIIAAAIFYMSSRRVFATGIGGGWQAIAYHFFAFFFLSAFLLLAIVRGKNKNLFFTAILIAIAYGISDEIHQFFVPNRNCCINDVLVNSLGIMFSGFFYSLRLKFRKKI